jgi:hypothetical protein
MQESVKDVRSCQSIEAAATSEKPNIAPTIAHLAALSDQGSVPRDVADATLRLFSQKF